jgi:hypothetical protein
MSHPLEGAVVALRCACSHFARADEVSTCRFCDCTHHRGVIRDIHGGHGPQTPPGAEAALQAFSDALEEARELLAERRDLEVDALAALKAAKRAALLSPECPKVRRNEWTVAERDAWAEDKCADEERAWMLARSARQAAADFLHTTGKQGGFQQSIGASVRTSYQGQWGGQR